MKKIQLIFKENNESVFLECASFEFHRDGGKGWFVGYSEGKAIAMFQEEQVVGWYQTNWQASNS